MPYKNPEDKRRWEREHREQRNARRREKRSAMQSRIVHAVPDPRSSKETTSGWKIFAGIAVGIGVALLSAVAGASQIDSGAHGSGQN